MTGPFTALAQAADVLDLNRTRFRHRIPQSEAEFLRRYRAAMACLPLAGQASEDAQRQCAAVVALLRYPGPTPEMIQALDRLRRLAAADVMEAA